MQINIPYGHESLSFQIPDHRLRGVLVSRLHNYVPEKSQALLVRDALESPIGSPPLYQLAKGKQKVVIIASDHTRPVPSKLLLPPMLEQIRRGNPQAQVTILIATGCHRETTHQELLDKFGPEILEKERLVIHDCDDASAVSLGTLPSGGECGVNRLVTEADLVVAEGFIEPHFFAGFSGGRKSILPGVAARQSVLANHCSEFIADPRARTGILEGNPIHRDMLWAARQAKLAFIVNVILNGSKQVIRAVAGDPELAHRAGCDFLSSLCRAAPTEADIVITSNGGYPLDQNIYQSVKGMTAAEATVRCGGVIIMVSRSSDGHGGEAFFRQLARESDPDKLEKEIRSKGRDQTEPDQWQTQVFLRVLKRASVIYLSDAPEEMVRAMHMIPAKDPAQAMALAWEIAGTDASVTVIPDGVSVIIEQ